MSPQIRNVPRPMGGNAQTRFGEGPADWLIIKAWSEYLGVRGRSERTIKSYRRTLVNFLADNCTDLLSVDEAMVTAHLDKLDRKGATRGMVVKSLGSFFTFAERRGYALENPVRFLSIPKPRQRPAPFLETDELARLVIAAAMHRPEDRRRPWAILLAYATGARVESLCSVRPEDVRSGSIDFLVAKGDKPYRNPLGPIGRIAADELLALINYAPPQAGRRRDTLLGVGPGQFWSWVNQAARDSGLRAWPHLLRHTFGTVLAPETDPATWADLMNHSDLSQYRRYAGVYEQRKRAAVGAL